MVSSKKQFQEKPSASKEKYHEIFNNATIGIGIADQMGRIIEYNNAILKPGNYSRDDISKFSNISDLYYNPDDRIKLLNIAKDQGFINETHVQFRRKDGTPYDTLFSLRPITIDGKSCWQAMVQDITERKKAELALKETHELLLKSQSLAKLGNWKWDVATGEVKWSAEVYNLFGLDPENFQPQVESIMKSFHPDDQNLDEKFLQEAIMNQGQYRYESRILLPDQSVRNLLSISEGIFDKEGNLTHMTGVVQDITKFKKIEEENKKLQAEFQQAQKMESIGTLAGGIAHDFNNILFPILGHADILLMDIPEDSPFRDSVNKIYTSALRAKELVKQILAFSREDTNKPILMKMQPVVTEALKLLRSTIPTTIDIKQDIEYDCGAIKADPTQIHQVVMNLVTNSFHAMEETGGELKVSFKEIELGEDDIITPDMEFGAYACLAISDTGTGMDKNVAEKIFDPFFTTKGIGKGTGMGLSVIHGIVKSLGAFIQVDSEPGKGTEFKVYFPVEQNSLEKQSIQIPETIQDGIERILLVDDEDAIVTMVKRMLEHLGYQVTSHTSSLETLEAFRTDPDRFDLVITDMAMPNMPGDKLAVELTKIRPDIPILICTGFSEKITEEKMASMGIKGLLLKPIAMKDLSQKIREVLDKDKSEEAS